MLKIAIVTNTLAPYLIPVLSKIAQTPGVCVHVFSATEREPNRLWDLPSLDFPCTILRENFLTLHQRYIHNNLDVVPALKRFAPDVVVTNGFNPTHLYAFAYASMMGIAHVVKTDGTDLSEQILSPIHRAVRRFVFARSQAFVAASGGGQRLFDSYGVPRAQRFTCCLGIRNELFFEKTRNAKKRFDFIFCGRIEGVKNPLFALDVAAQVAKRLQRKTKILFVGSGGMEENVAKAAGLYADLIEAEFHGFARQDELPGLYGAARLFLFPTLWDPWGVVANEACAAGLPVLVSPHAGVAGDLVRDGENGFVCDLDINLWADKAEYLLTRDEAYRKFSACSRFNVSRYTFDEAADGLLSACRMAQSLKEEKKAGGPVKSRPRVLIVERQLLQYRTAFYNRLRTLLDREGIELQLLVGNGTRAEEKKVNQAMLDWAIHVPARYLPGTKLCWQPFGNYAKDADLVVVMHENKIIYNLWLLSFGRPKRIAFWGHGRNMQSNRPNGLKERFKRWTLRQVDWWFAYTDTSAALVTDAGFPRECTTVVENAIDTKEMIAFCAQVSTAECESMRKELGLEDGRIALCLGPLYKEKRLGFLLDAALRIREKIPDFQLLVVGDGPESARIEAAASRYSWIRYLGPLQGRNKAVVLVMAHVILNPGLVGLGILESFASGTPMFTTDCGLHSPEISYLSSGTNGVMTDNDVVAYANTVIDVLHEPEAIARLSKGALSCAPRYTIENMANRIRMGICDCLASH